VESDRMTESVKTTGWRGSEALWLGAAYDLLLNQGVEAVRVLPLAKSLNLSRTSFYSHFDSREALLDALINRWREKNTGNLVGRTTAPAKTIAQALFNLFDCWLSTEIFDDRFDFAIRNWALGTQSLKEIVEANDGARIAAIQAMFERFGFAPDQAQVRAFTVYYTQIGYISMMVRETKEARIARMPHYIETFSGTRATEAELAEFRTRHTAPRT
jgi:AcrR family transcriptional regulator